MFLILSTKFFFNDFSDIVTKICVNCLSFILPNFSRMEKKCLKLSVNMCHMYEYFPRFWPQVTCSRFIIFSFFFITDNKSKNKKSAKTFQSAMAIFSIPKLWKCPVCQPKNCLNVLESGQKKEKELTCLPTFFGRKFSMTICLLF